MAFLKEKLNAFFDQPTERKRSDHRLKNVESCVDTRSWVLDEELKRQQFLNVVNRTGDGSAGEGGAEDEEEELSRPASQRFVQEEAGLELQEKIKALDGDKDFLRNIIADKENEIERLLYRVRAMAEADTGGVGLNGFKLPLQTQLSDLMKQLKAKDEELKNTKEMLNSTEKMLTDLQKLIESTGDDPEKQKAHLDDIMKGLQAGMQVDIEKLEDQVKTLQDKLNNANEEIGDLKRDLAMAQEQIEALASGDGNELNKIILGLRNELDDMKASKNKENNFLRDVIAQKDNELQNIKGVSQDTKWVNLQDTAGDDYSPKGKTKKQHSISSLPTDKASSVDSKINNLKNLIAERDNEIRDLKEKLENEKNTNNTLKNQINTLADSDENGLKSNILALTAELEELKSKGLKDKDNLTDPLHTNKIKDLTMDELRDKIKDFEMKLNNEKEINVKLRKELQNERDKLIDLVSADDNELKRLLANAETENNKLKKEKENDGAFIESLIGEVEKLKKEPVPTKKSVEPSQDSQKIPILESDLDKLKEENINLKNENDYLKKQAKEQTPHIPVLNLSPEEILMNKNGIINELKTLQAENKELKDLLNASDNALKPIQKSEEIAPIKPETDQQKLVKMEPDDPELADKNKQLMVENKVLRNENESLKKALKDMENGTAQNKLVMPGEVKISKPTDDAIDKNNLKIENGRLNNALKRETDSNKMLKEKVDALEKENSKLKGDLDILNKKPKEDLQGTTSKLDDTQFDQEKPKPAQHTDLPENELKDKILLLEADNNRLKKTIKEEKDKCNDTISNKDKNIEQLQNDSNKLQSEKDLLKKENNSLKDEINALQNKKLELASTSIEEKHDAEKCVKEKQNLEAENKKLNERLALVIKDQQSSATPQDQSKTKFQTRDISKEDGSLSKENENLKNEIKELRKKIDDPKYKDDKMSKENDLLKKKVEQLQDNNKMENEKLKNEIKLLKEKLEVLEKPMSSSTLRKEEDVVKQQDGNKALKERVKVLESKPNEPEAETISKRTDENTNLKKRNNALAQEIETLKMALDESRHLAKAGIGNKDNLKLLEENEKLKQNILSLEDEIKEYKKKLPKDKEKPVTNFQGEKEEVKGLKEDVSKLTKENDELKKDLERLRSKLPEKSQKPEQFQSDILDDSVMKLNNQQISKENEKLKAEVQSLNKTKESNEQLSKENKKLRDELEQLKKLLEASEEKDKLKHKTDDVTKLKAENLKLTTENGNLNEIKQNNQQLLKENKKLKAEVERLNQTKENNEQLTKENNKLKEKIENFEKLPEASKKQDKLNPESVEVNKLKADNLKLSTENETLKDEIQNLKVKPSVTKDKHEDPQPVNAYTKEIEQLKADIERLKSKSPEKTKTPETKDLVDVDGLKGNNLKLLNENEKLKSIVENLKAHGISEKPEKQKSETDDIKKLKADNLKLTKENELLKSKINQAEDNPDKSDTNQNKLRTDADNLTKENRALQGKVKELEKDNENLKSKLLDIDKSFNNIKKQKLDCEDENKKLLDLINKYEESGDLNGSEVLSTYKSNADNLKKENDKFKDKIAALEEELQNLRDTNRKLQDTPEVKAKAGQDSQKKMLAQNNDDLKTIKAQSQKSEPAKTQPQDDKKVKEDNTVQPQSNSKPKAPTAQSKIKEREPEGLKNDHIVNKRSDKIQDKPKVDGVEVAKRSKSPSSPLEKEQETDYNKNIETKQKKAETDPKIKLQQDKSKSPSPPSNILQEEKQNIQQYNIGGEKKQDTDSKNNDGPKQKKAETTTKIKPQGQSKSPSPPLNIQQEEKQYNVGREREQDTDSKNNDGPKQKKAETTTNIKPQDQSKSPSPPLNIPQEENQNIQQYNKGGEKKQDTDSKNNDGPKQKKPETTTKIKPQDQSKSPSQPLNVQQEEKQKKQQYNVGRERKQDTDSESNDGPKQKKAKTSAVKKPHEDKSKSPSPTLNRIQDEKHIEQDRKLETDVKKNDRPKQQTETNSKIKPQEYKKTKRGEDEKENLLMESDKQKLSEVGKLQPKIKSDPLEKEKATKEDKKKTTSTPELRKEIDKRKKNDIDALPPRVKRHNGDLTVMEDKEEVEVRDSSPPKRKSGNRELKSISDKGKGRDDQISKIKSYDDGDLKFTIEKDKDKTTKKTKVNDGKLEENIKDTKTKSEGNEPKGQKGAIELRSGKAASKGEAHAPVREKSRQREETFTHKSQETKETLIDKHDDQGRDKQFMTQKKQTPKKQVEKDFQELEAEEKKAYIDKEKLEEHKILEPKSTTIDKHGGRGKGKELTTKKRGTPVKSVEKHFQELEVEERKPSIDKDKFEERKIFFDKDKLDLVKSKPDLKLTEKDKLSDKDKALKLDYESKAFVDKEYDNELNKLKKKLYEAERLIVSLNNEILKLKTDNDKLRQVENLKGDNKEKHGVPEKYLGEATNKLNKILRKAIQNGLKSLNLEELEFVHDSLNNTMAQRQGRPVSPGRSNDELENIIKVMEQRMLSLMRRLDIYRQHSSDQEKTIMEYSQKVQRLSTTVGLLEMKAESLQYETKQLRDIVSYEKEKSKRLEEMLKSVLDNCKCTRKWVLHQNYPGISRK